MAYAHKMHLHLKKGALHRELDVPTGKKIPAKKLDKAAHSDNPLLKKRAVLAETMKHEWHHHSHAESYHPHHDSEVVKHAPQLAEDDHMKHPFGHPADHHHI
jgi:hypothetical protein